MILVTRLTSRMNLVIIFAVSLSAVARESPADTMEEVVDAVARLCTLPGDSGQAIEYEVEGDSSISLKIFGIAGKGKLSKKEWEGVQDVLAEHRGSDRASSRACVQQLLPPMLKAYTVPPEVTSLLEREQKMQSQVVSEEPAPRSAAFRDAFRSVGSFVVDLTPINPNDGTAKGNEVNSERSIAGIVTKFEYSTGKFEGQTSEKKTFQGQMAGDTLSFVSYRCSGALKNVIGTWGFYGPVACTSGNYNGIFSLH